VLNPFKANVSASYDPRDNPVLNELTISALSKDEADVWLETVHREKVDKVVRKEKPQKVRRFFVIGGCFEQFDNAERLVKKLKRLGFDAQLVGKNKRNLHRVAYGSYETRSDAKRNLKKIKRSQIQSAWLFVKR
jgi:cell division protein FtsN